MSKPSAILIGAGGHAHACIDVIEQDGQYQIAGLVGMKEELHTRHLGYVVLATDAELPQLAREYEFAFITVGQIRSPDARIRLYELAKQCGFTLPAIVAPTALASRHATIGAGTMVMHGAMINAGAKVGQNCIVNTNALIEHDAVVEDHCHISTGAILNGSVHVGAGSFVGSGSVVKDGVALGKSCLISMGRCVWNNQPDFSRILPRDTS